jgi:hypothetical protein
MNSPTDLELELIVDKAALRHGAFNALAFLLNSHNATPEEKSRVINLLITVLDGSK